MSVAIKCKSSDVLQLKMIEFGFKSYHGNPGCDDCTVATTGYYHTNMKDHPCRTLTFTLSLRRIRLRTHLGSSIQAYAALSLIQSRFAW